MVNGRCARRRYVGFSGVPRLGGAETAASAADAFWGNVARAVGQRREARPTRNKLSRDRLLLRRAKRGFQVPGRTQSFRSVRDIAGASLKDLRRAEGLFCRCFREERDILHSFSPSARVHTPTRTRAEFLGKIELLKSGQRIHRPRACGGRLGAEHDLPCFQQVFDDFATLALAQPLRAAAQIGRGDLSFSSTNRSEHALLPRVELAVGNPCVRQRGPRPHPTASAGRASRARRRCAAARSR